MIPLSAADLRPAGAARAGTRPVGIAARLFRLLDETGIGYCLVGDIEGLPDHIGSDLDIVVDRDRVTEMPGLVARFAAAEGGRLVQLLQHEPTGWYFVIAGFDAGGRPWMLHPDLCTDYYRHGRRFLDNATLLRGRRPAVAPGGTARGFPVAAPAVEFAYYLIKKIDKRALSAEHAAHLSRIWRQDPAGAAAAIAPTFKEFEARLIAGAAESGDWSAVIAEMPRLRKALFRAGDSGAGARFRDLRRVAGRLFYRTGLTVTVLGPDGSGKSSVIGRLTAHLAPAFRHTRVLHLRPRLGEREKTAPPVSDPHRLPPRGRLHSMAKLLYYLADHAAGHWLVVRPALVRSTLVVFDRYFHDLLVDPRRYRYGAGKTLAGLAARFVPRPDLWLILDAPAEVTLRRKGELGAAEAARQRAAYLAFARRLPNAHVIDASRPLNEVVAEAERIVLDHLARRTAQRLRLAKS